MPKNKSESSSSTATPSIDILADQEWQIIQADCIRHMPTMPEHCADFAVFSPPFPSLYAYTDSQEDVGNSENFAGDAKLHLSFFYHQLSRIVKPGRAIAVHCMQIPRLKRTGEVGLHDFRGLNIRLGERSGLIYEYDWSIRKNPQAQAIRTKSRELQFAGLETDRARSRGALADYILKFRVPGENAKPVVDNTSVSREAWIRYAEHHWDDIRETHTLNVAEGRDADDVKHICPLQLPIIERLIRLFTLTNEIVFSPFAGIGSEGHEALRLGRRFYGIELKDSYVNVARKNMERAIQKRSENEPLFDSARV